MHSYRIMSANMKRAAELIAWNRRVLSIIGMWPTDSTFVHFYINYMYYIAFMTLAFVNLYSVFGDMQLMIANLLETSVQMMFSVKMIVLRHSATLREVLLRIKLVMTEDNFQNEADKELYLAYNTVGRTWFLTLHYLAIMTGVVYYIGPMKDIVVAALANETLPYILPFKTHLFFDIEDVYIYVLMYASQFPMVYYNYCHVVTVALLCTLVIHAAGEMSALANRIRRIGSTSESSGCEDVTFVFNDIIKEHLQVMWQASEIDNIFNLLLLEELLISTMLFGFVSFNLLSSSDSMYDKLFLAIYCLAMLGIILVYCITGDYIIRESENIHDAFWECRWYEIETRHQKNLILWLVRAKQPLQLTAGGFYVFSLPRFSEILKTAMAYVTMLRAVI